MPDGRAGSNLPVVTSFPAAANPLLFRLARAKEVQERSIERRESLLLQPVAGDQVRLTFTIEKYGSSQPHIIRLRAIKSQGK